ncbi:hypothetical protein [Glaciecola sp. 1036]|uniref:hypothetical protein n=1 Tax=Alteromonadaceae TaxID=72275 RepID=UPI003D07DD47
MEDIEPQKQTDPEDLKNLYLFDEIFRFARNSTGIALAISYLLLVLSSMCYLHIMYSQLNVNILQLVTFEDILATPIKNPDIVIVFLLLLVIFYLADVGNRYRARTLEKYSGDKLPFRFRILMWVLWAPKKRKDYMKTTLFIIAISLFVYVFVFASQEAENILDGEGSMVEISFPDQQEKLQTTLLGTTNNYVITFDTETGKATAFYIQGIKSIEKLSIKTVEKAPEKIEKTQDESVVVEKEKITTQYKLHGDFLILNTTNHSELNRHP